MGSQISIPPGASRSAAYLHKDTIEDVQRIFNELRYTQTQVDSSKVGTPSSSSSSESRSGSPIPSHSISRSTFGTYFRYPEHICDAIFDEFDADNNGTLDADEFMRGMALCSSGSLDSKVRFCFESFDASGDGFLQRAELQEILLSTTFSSFALLEAVGRSMDRASQESRKIAAQSGFGPGPDGPMDRLVKKANFKGEVDWMVQQAYANSDPNDDGKLSYREFFRWVSNTPQVMEVLYGLFQLKHEAEGPHAITGNNRKERQSGLFRRSGKVTPESEGMSSFHDDWDGTGQKDLGSSISGFSSKEYSNEDEVKINTGGDSKKRSNQKKRQTSLVSKSKSDGSGSSLVNSQSRVGILRKSWRRIGLVTFLISVFGILCMVVERLVLHHVYHDEPNAFTHVLRYVVSVDCFLLVISYVTWTKAYLAMLRAQGHVNPLATICSTPYIRNRLALEIFTSLLHVPPHVMEILNQHSPGASYWLTNILSWSMLLRLHVMPSMVQQYFLEKHVTLKQEFLAKLSRVQFSVMFTLRAELSIAPFRLVIVTLGLVMIIATFLFEEAELGLDCLKIGEWQNTTNTSNATNMSSAFNTLNAMSMPNTINVTYEFKYKKVHSGGEGGAGTADDWNWIYEGRCHSPAPLSGTGWLYFALNVALAVDPLRIPYSPSGEAFGILTGGASLVLFAITVSAVQDMLHPTREEMRVIHVIREERIRLLTRKAAVSLIQRSWRIYARTKRHARRIGGPDFEASFGPHWDDLGSEMKSFRKRLATSRKQISVSLWRWKQLKRSLHANTPMLESISSNVSHVLDVLVRLESEHRHTYERISQLEERASKEIGKLIRRVEIILKHTKARK